MRLLLTADAIGGVWTYATELGHALAPLGIEATIAVLGPPPSEAQRVMARGLCVIETALPVDWLCDGPAPVLAAGEAIARLGDGYDCVQLNMPALAAATRPTVPTVAVVHGCVATWWEASRGTPLDPAYAWHGAMMRAGLRAADRVVAPSAAYGEAVARRYGIPAPAVVHNGRAAPPPGRDTASHDFAFTAGRLWDDAKNVAVLDRAAARLAVPFLAAGAVRGPQGERIVLDHLVALGQLGEADIARRLAARPVFVSSARFEPFGLAVLEAAAAGCPLVLADIPTFHELWEGAATFVDANDDAGFARAIETIIGDAGLRLAFGERARARAACYTPAAMARGMAAIYAALPRRSADLAANRAAVPAAARAAA